MNLANKNFVQLSYLYKTLKGLQLHDSDVKLKEIRDKASSITDEGTGVKFAAVLGNPQAAYCLKLYYTYKVGPENVPQHEVGLYEPFIRPHFLQGKSYAEKLFCGDQMERQVGS